MVSIPVVAHEDGILPSSPPSSPSLDARMKYPTLASRELYKTRTVRMH
jgi:hypothetical protein